MPELPAPSGALMKNTLLAGAEYIARAKLIGPETLAFSPTNASLLYTGLANGQIVCVNLNSGAVSRLAQIGDEVNEEVCSRL